MVIYGLNDTQTSSVDARHAAETLSRSQVIEVPEAGHGSIIFSQCVKDIGLAFIERPETATDTACLASLKPKFVLPPGQVICRRDRASVSVGNSPKALG